MIDALAENGVAVMDRGFASLDFLKQNIQNNKYFVVRIPNNYKLEFDEDSELSDILPVFWVVKSLTKNYLL